MNSLNMNSHHNVILCLSTYMYQGFKKGSWFQCFSYIFKRGFYNQTHENKLVSCTITSLISRKTCDQQHPLNTKHLSRYLREIIRSCFIVSIVCSYHWHKSNDIHVSISALALKRYLSLAEGS